MLTIAPYYNTLITILIAIITLVTGAFGGVAYAHRSMRVLLRKHDREIGENGIELKNLRSYVNGVNEKTDQCMVMHMKTLELLSANTTSNNEMASQNKILLTAILRGNNAH